MAKRNPNRPATEEERAQLIEEWMEEPATSRKYYQHTGSNPRVKVADIPQLTAWRDKLQHATEALDSAIEGLLNLGRRGVVVDGSATLEKRIAEAGRRVNTISASVKLLPPWEDR